MPSCTCRLISTDSPVAVTDDSGSGTVSVSHRGRLLCGLLRKSYTHLA
jgi:hypothetical protein